MLRCSSALFWGNILPWRHPCLRLPMEYSCMYRTRGGWDLTQHVIDELKYSLSTKFQITVWLYHGFLTYQSEWKGVLSLLWGSGIVASYCMFFLFYQYPSNKKKHKVFSLLTLSGWSLFPMLCSCVIATLGWLPIFLKWIVFCRQGKTEHTFQQKLKRGWVFIFILILHDIIVVKSNVRMFYAIVRLI